jgi:NADH-quinone oxidoreductase subunit A
MTGQAVDTAPLWPLAVFFVCVVALAATMLAVSFVLGQRHRDRTTAEAYESGIVPTGRAHLRFNVTFYLVAMLFVIFDIESVFIFSWAIAVRELGWQGYIAMSVFIVVLLVSLFYLNRAGALNWRGLPADKQKRTTEVSNR